MTRLERITSSANPFLRNIRKAVVRHTVTDDGLAIAEGFHLLEEAVRSRAEVQAVIASEAALSRVPSADYPRLVAVPERLFDSLSGTEAAQGVLTLLRLPRWREEDLMGRAGLKPLIVILDGVQDPGNAGSIARAAEAFGGTGIIFGAGSARPANPKALRASAGSLFRLPFLELPPEAMKWDHTGISTFRAMPFAPSVPAVDQVDLSCACAIVIGSEGRGVGNVYAPAAPVAIPTGSVESLNAAVAASILLYEAQRQRSGRRL